MRRLPLRRATLSRTAFRRTPLHWATLSRTPLGSLPLSRTSLGTTALTRLSTLPLLGLPLCRLAVCSSALTGLAILAGLTRLPPSWTALRGLSVSGLSIRSPTLARLSTLALARPTWLPRLPLSATAGTGVSGASAGERVLGRLVATQLDESPDCRS